MDKKEKFIEEVDDFILDIRDLTIIHEKSNFSFNDFKDKLRRLCNEHKKELIKRYDERNHN